MLLKTDTVWSIYRNQIKYCTLLLSLFQIRGFLPCVMRVHHMLQGTGVVKPSVIPPVMFSTENPRRSSSLKYEYLQVIMMSDVTKQKVEWRAKTLDRENVFFLRRKGGSGSISQ